MKELEGFAGRGSEARLFGGDARPIDVAEQANRQASESRGSRCSIAVPLIVFVHCAVLDVVKFVLDLPVFAHVGEKFLHVECIDLPFKYVAVDAVVVT